jgi:hypothetical protein
MTAALIANIILAAAVLSAVVVLLSWAIVTAYRDQGVTIAPRRRRERTAPHPAVARGRTHEGEAWPAS